MRSIQGVFDLVKFWLSNNKSDIHFSPVQPMMYIPNQLIGAPVDTQVLDSDPCITQVTQVVHSDPVATEVWHDSVTKLARGCTDLKKWQNDKVTKEHSDKRVNEQIEQVT